MILKTLIEWKKIFKSGIEKNESENHRETVADFTKTIQLNPKNIDAYWFSSIDKCLTMEKSQKKQEEL